MPEFKKFGDAIAKRVDEITAMGPRMYLAGNGRDLWDVYISSFPEGTDPIVVSRTLHDCSCCKHFIRDIGNAFSIDDKGAIHTIWEVEAEYPYDVVAAACDEYVRKTAFSDVFLLDRRSAGVKTSVIFDKIADKTHTWHHFYAKVDDKFVTNSYNITSKKAEFRDTVDVVRRGLDMYSAASAEIVLDLIESNSIYRGNEFKGVLSGFLALKTAYDKLNDRRYFPIVKAYDLGAQIRRNVISSLLDDMKTDDIETAVVKFGKKLDPTNYKRPKSIVTRKMIDDSLATLNELGLVDSLQRRHATLDDIDIENLLYKDGTSTSLHNTDLDNLRQTLYKSAQKKTAKKDVTSSDITIEEFLTNVVPNASKIEAFNGPNVVGNFVTVTTGKHKSSDPLFSWGNHFSWVYDGGVTDSYIKEKVGNAGGNVNAPFRVSLAWSNRDDLDLSCIVDGKAHSRIYYASKQGILDVDMNVSEYNLSDEPVENLSWTRVRDGVYDIYVDEYRKRSRATSGFELELEFKGVVRRFKFDGATRNMQHALSISIVNGEIVSLKVAKDIMLTSETGVDKWGLNSNEWYKVDAIFLSPNYWNGEGEGNKHFIFAIEGCKNPDPVRGIFNEFIKPSLYKHRRAFELLGSHTMVEPSDAQLSGFGFSTTKAANINLRVNGGRVYNVVF